MKPRRVIVTIELTTAVSVKNLKHEYLSACIFYPEEKVHQVQVNIVKPIDKSKCAQRK